jgi:hypothetical protein
LAFHSWRRFAARVQSGCEAIVDAMFGFELRKEEIEHLTRRRGDKR